MPGKIGVVREMALRSEPVSGWGFTVGERYQTTLIYRRQDEARAARKKVLDAVSAAVETIERWAPDKR